jgi:hypothetical protein
LPTSGPASFGTTLGSQYSRILGPAANQLSFYTSSDYDPDVQVRAEEYIKSEGLTGDDADYIRRFGIGSDDNLIDAINTAKRRRADREILENSTGFALFVTDPALAFSFGFPGLGVRAALYVGRGLQALQAARAVPGIGSRLMERATQAFGDDLAGIARFAPERMAQIPYVGAARSEAAAEAFSRPVSMAVSAQALISRRNYSASELAKIAALDAAVVDGSLSLVSALNEISFGEDVAETLTNAALYTAGVTAFGGLLGYGLGAALGAPLRQVERARQFSENFQRHLREVSQRPTPETTPIVDGKVQYAGAWFTESAFFKSVPTPVRTTVLDNFLPDKWKQEMLKLGNDMGMVFRENQAGISSGTSVFLNSGRRLGEWYSTLKVIDESFKKVNPTGASEFMNVPVGAMIETVRRKLGKDVIRPGDWYDHVGRLYIEKTPYDKMTPEEAASVQALQSFFQRYEGELTGLGLINQRDVFFDAYLKEAGRQGKAISLVNSIIAQNRRWMTRERTPLLKKLEPKQAKLEALRATQQSRGLTDNQLKLLNQLEEEVADLQVGLEKFDSLFKMIDDAASVDDLTAMRNQLDLTPPMTKALGKLEESITAMRAEIDALLEMIEEGSRRGADADPYFFRIWNRRAIEENTDAFRNILVNWFRDNNVIYRRDDKGRFVRVEMPTDSASLITRADETINNILGEFDDDAIDAIFSGYGRNGPMISRTLNIPNALVKDFMVTNVREVMLSYTQRVAPKIEFHKAFPHPTKPGKLMTLEERVDLYRKEMTEEGIPEQSIDRFIKNFVAVYDQVVGSNVKRPDAIDSKIANVLRTATTWTFLGGSGVAALGDTASLLMDHEMKMIGRAFIAALDDPSILPKAKRELNLAGEALEIAAGLVHLRTLESQSRDAFSRGISDKLNNGFFIANGLGPVTIATKVMDGLLRGHTLIEASQRLVAGNANDFERTFLARYNITEDMARRIIAMPFEETNNKLKLANTEAWDDEGALIAFRNALRAGVANRIIMGTPADKPLVMSGATYIPDALAARLPFELPVDPRVKGYRRLESGLLTLPFTFYTYTMGALSKITANHAAGAVRNRLSHIAVAMILGGMIVKFRTPSWAWDEMDTEDKVMRAFDFSGLAALYSDAGYRALSMAQELGFENNFPIQPKFQSDPDPLGALVSLGGAPADWSYEVVKAASQLAQGDFQDGAKGLIRMMPLIDAMMTGGVIKDTASDLADMLPNRP